MRSIRSVSVLVPTFQGREFQGRLFEALAGQELGLTWDVHVVDSGSTDGTWECLGEWATRFPVPFSRQRIHPLEFDHGDTRNLLAARSAGDLCVFLTQDAIPLASDWLARLVADFDDESVGGAYCRNVPRPDARLLTRIMSAGDPGYATETRVTRLPDSETYAALSPHERRLLYNFNDVASAIRRELWERHPFPRTNFGEDVLMARALLEAGFAIVYDAQATVEHSHDYDARQLYERAWIDGRFNAEWLDRVCVGSRSDVEVLVQRVLRGDATVIGTLALARSAEQHLLEEAETSRRATFLGLYQGGQSARRRRATRLRESGSLRVLMVVHGFPPDTWAGTEVYTLNLARELVARGHTVTILTRSPARAEDEVDFDVLEEVFEGLRVLRMVHRLEHGRLSESYSSSAAEEAFGGVLERECPDVVHFQHLIHTSAGLVYVARGLEIPTLITCHDYWALCARVQFIRPDGVICEHNMGSGCFLCVKEQGLSRIESAQRMDVRAGEVVRGHARDLVRGRETSEASRRRAEEYLDLRAREEVVPAAYAACDLRISPSRFLRERYLQSGHFDPQTFLFSDNGMRTDHVQALAKVPDEQGRLRFGFVGSLVWYKGVEVLVRALQRLAGEPCVLNVYGDFHPEEDAHHSHLEQLARTANVHFRGRFDNARLSEVYAEIDVLVVPSVWLENSPITIHEAFLTRTPVLASGIGGMAEFVRDGVDGLHFAVGDDADLATKMRRLMTEDGLLERLQEDFLPVKTIEQNAAEMEFRYRALCCRVPGFPTPGFPTAGRCAPDRRTAGAHTAGAPTARARSSEAGQ